MAYQAVIAKQSKESKCNYSTVGFSERQLERFEKVHDANREYLDYDSASSSEIKTCKDSKHCHEEPLLQVENLKKVVDKKTAHLL